MGREGREREAVDGRDAGDERPVRDEIQVRGGQYETKIDES
jgi:hypothetical protein